MKVFAKRMVIRWILQVGLPIAALLIAISFFPFETEQAKGIAQAVAVLLPIVIEVAILARWNRQRAEEQARHKLKLRLHPLVDQPNAGLDPSLDDPAYRVTTFWGRSAQLKDLSQARQNRPHGAMVVTGAAWTGKTRLLTEWALGLPSGVIAGWLPANNVTDVVNQAVDLGTPVVILDQGKDAQTLEALAALVGSEGAVTLVIERRNAAHLIDLARQQSPATRRLIDSAHVLKVSSPGTPADYEHRYGSMVTAYARAAGKREPSLPPRPPRQWSVEPVGMIGALAMLEAIQGRRAHDSMIGWGPFARFWDRLSTPWLKQAPGQRFGLPPLSGDQLDAAISIALITNGRCHNALAALPLFEGLTAHQAEQLVRWVSELNSTDDPAQITLLAAIADSEAWTPDLREAVANALRTHDRKGFVLSIRQCLAAEELMRQRPALTTALVRADYESIRATLLALITEETNQSVDGLLEGQIEIAALSGEEVKLLLAESALARTPHAHVSLLQRQFDLLVTDVDPSERAELAIALARHCRTLGRHKQALTASKEAVELYRGLVNTPNNTDQTTITERLATALINLRADHGNLGQHDLALTAIDEAVELYRELVNTPNNTDQTTITERLATALNSLSVAHVGLGQYDLALTAIDEAVELYRGLVNTPNTDQTEITERLAVGLINLSAAHGNLGQHDLALTAIDEAVELYRGLVNTPNNTDQTKITESLATALINLSVDHGNLGQHDLALTAIDEAVELYRGLVNTPNTDQTKITESLATALINLSAAHGNLGQHDLALTAIDEAVELYRGLVNTPNTDQTEITESLAVGLINLSVAHVGLGQYDLALTAIDEAVELYRGLVNTPNTDQTEITEYLAGALTKLARLRRRQHSEVDHADAPIALLIEAVSLLRKLRDEAGTPMLSSQIRKTEQLLYEWQMAEMEEAEAPDRVLQSSRDAAITL